MFRNRGDNHHFIYVLLFLSVAFFFLEYQDEEKFARLFSFQGGPFAAGEVWRIFTYQFTQAGQGFLFFPKPVVLFFTLLILYIMGAALEEAWGTRGFLTLFSVSTIASAGAAAALGIPILGAYFVNYTLLFVFAALFPGQTFYLFAIVPLRVRWVAYVAGVFLLLGMVVGDLENIAAFAGAAAGFLYYWRSRVPAIHLPQRSEVEEDDDPPFDQVAVRNAARFVAIKRALNTRADGEITRLAAQFEREIVPGVNICPPVDYKPENADGYCIRCEGFAECSSRYLKMNRAASPSVMEAPALPEPSV